MAPNFFYCISCKLITTVIIFIIRMTLYFVKSETGAKEQKFMTIRPTYTKTLCILASGQAKLCDLLESIQTTNKILHTAQFANTDKIKRLISVLECQTYLVDLMRKELQDLTECLQNKMPK